MTSVNWELTPYEQSRKPHETLPGNTEIAVSPCNLHSELQCPICLDILTNTMTTKECLHRFCAECITTALRNGNKECPTCRKKLVSHRSLRKDTTFDAIVAKIFPDRKVYQEEMEKRIAKIMQANVSERYGQHVYVDRANGNVPLPKSDEASESLSTSSLALGVNCNGDIPVVIELQMKLHEESAIDKNDVAFFKSKYFSTSPNASMDHLVEFLKIRFQAFRQHEKMSCGEEIDPNDLSSIECHYEFSIYLPSQIDLTSASHGAPLLTSPLDGQITLAQLLSQLSVTNIKDPVELIYLAKKK